MGNRRSDAIRVPLAMTLALMAVGCTRSTLPPETVAPKYEGAIASRDVVEGGRIYVELCAACHDGRVNPKGYHWSPGQMRHQIREGNRLMPPLNHELLSDAQVEAVLAYLSVMGTLDGSLPPPTRSNQRFAHHGRAGREAAEEEEPFVAAAAPVEEVEEEAEPEPSGSAVSPRVAAPTGSYVHRTWVVEDSDGLDEPGG
jgi:cytochrome c5